MYISKHIKNHLNKLNIGTSMQQCDQANTQHCDLLLQSRKKYEYTQ